MALRTVVLVFLLGISLSACSRSFKVDLLLSTNPPVPYQGSKPIDPPPSPKPTDKPTATPTPDPDPRHLVSSFSLGSDKDGREVWIVTRGGPGGINGLFVHHIIINKASGYPLKSWKLTSKPMWHGLRTYVTEIGLLVGVTGGTLYRVSADMPETATFEPIWEAARHTPVTPLLAGRICPTSYKKNGATFIGVAWTQASGTKAYTEIPVDLSKDNKVDLARATTITLGGAQKPDSWAYGCYTDQKNKRLWAGGAASIDESTEITGIDLQNLREIPPNMIPNANNDNPSLGSMHAKPAGGNTNYAISGDNEGNVLLGYGIYTYSYDSVSNAVMGGIKRRKNFYIIDRDCFTTSADCSRRSFEVDVGKLGISYIGPISSLNDGRFVGLERDKGARVFLISLKDVNNLSAGIDVELIKTLPGDPYMYNDFTGASLYSVINFDEVVDLRKLPDYKLGAPIKSTWFVWQASGAPGQSWLGLTMDAYCYNSASGDPQRWIEVKPINKAGTKTTFAIDSCKSGNFDRIRIRIKPTSDGVNFTHVDRLNVYADQ